MKIENLCIKCMKEKSSPDAVCEHCGFDPAAASVPPHHLSPFVILAGKYLVGMAIGEGGFGITYIGIDLNLEMRVAIKEYYPNGCAVRDMSGNSSTVQSYTGEQQGFFEAGREKFINEAKILAKCIHLPEIVTVKDFFKENHTAYIVMEYVDGKTLKDYLKEKGGRLSVNETLQMLGPVIRSLGEVHKMNLIHRDISPDNIMIQKNGSIKVLDFGGARDFGSGGRSMSIMLKPGYAPEEQYRTHGEQGPWTDVYAICATMYRCITGEIPPEAMERSYQDKIKPFSAFQISCPANVEAAVFKGLSVYKNGRFQSMEELHHALYQKTGSIPHVTQTGNRTGGGKPPVVIAEPGPGNRNSAPPDKPLKMLALILGCVMLLVVGAAAVVFLIKTDTDKIESEYEEVVTPAAESESGAADEPDSDTEPEPSSESDSSARSDSPVKVKTEAQSKPEAESEPAPDPEPAAAVDKIDEGYVNTLLQGRNSKAVHSLYLYDLQQNTDWGTANYKEAFPASALISVPILYTTAKMIDNGLISMDTSVAFEYTYSGGRGNLTASQNGQAMTIESLLSNMLMYSDNNATNTLISALTMEKINNTCQGDGFSSVDMQRKIEKNPSPDLNNFVSAKDVALMIKALYNNTFMEINRDYICRYMKIEDKAGCLGIFKSDLLYNGGKYCNQNGIIPDKVSGRYTEAGIVFADGKEYIIGTMAEGGDANVAAEEISDACVYIHGCMKEG